jgi:hypothetical protein
MSNTIKNEARWRGGLEAGQKALSAYSINNNNDFINSLYDRVGLIVADKCAPIQIGGYSFSSGLKPANVLSELESDALTILASEIRCFPEIAKALPLSFRQAVASGYPQNLTDLQRAALILATDETPPAEPYAEHFAMNI